MFLYRVNYFAMVIPMEVESIKFCGGIFFCKFMIDIVTNLKMGGWQVVTKIINICPRQPLTREELANKRWIFM